MTRSRRYEFTKGVQREAWARSEGRCEATGAVYGLSPGQRCNTPLAGRRKEYDHYPKPATEEGSDTLDNCVVCCDTCHGYKTRTFDIPVQAKVKRVSDKHLGIGSKPSQWSQRPKQKAPPQNKASRAITPKFEGDIMANPSRVKERANP
jgi:5-methylcytosine-specific restriction protein A